MAKRTTACGADDHSGGGAGVTIAGYAGDVCVGIAPERYDQIPHLGLIHLTGSIDFRG